MPPVAVLDAAELARAYSQYPTPPAATTAPPILTSVSVRRVKQVRRGQASYIGIRRATLLLDQTESRPNQSLEVQEALYTRVSTRKESRKATSSPLT